MTSSLFVEGGHDIGLTGLCRTCPHCGRSVVHLRTYLQGRPLVFDTEATVLRGNNDGWIAGDFRVDGTRQRLLAPVFAHPWSRRRTARTGYRIHQCRRAA